MRRHVAIVGLVWLVLTLAGLILAQVAFEPGAFSDKGQMIDATFRTLLIMSVPVFTFVIAILGYSMFAFRHRGQPDGDGAPLTGRGRLPLAWFVVTSAMALGVMVYPGLTELPNVVHLDAQPDVVVRIQGQQWRWSVQYPQSGAKSNNELVLPVNRKIGFEITSIDVIHSVWIPAFRMRVDAVPGLTTYMSFTPTGTGDYTTDSGLRLQCSQLCGLNHATMEMPVKVVTDAEFATWLAANGGGQPSGPSGGGQPVTIEATAGAATSGFATKTLDAKAGTAITFTFKNDDPGTVHNFAVTANGKTYATDFKPGPATTTVDVPALPAGNYQFLCQAHPTTMTGTLTVK
ncbi:MAG TPA: cytochrome c oxidase subunit II [Candidatus Limnocylindrales bacterium]